LPGMVIYNLAALLEVIQFFQNRDRNDDIVFFKIVDAGTVMENNVGVEDEDLFCHRRG
jgi:hypothetical protein